MLTMVASSEMLGSSNTTHLFHIRPIEAETEIQISCLSRPIFKKILKASGDRHIESVACASLQLSALTTLYTLKMNFSAKVIVKSSRSPFPRFLCSMWCSVNVFHDVFLPWPAK